MIALFSPARLSALLLTAAAIAAAPLAIGPAAAQDANCRRVSVPEADGLNLRPEPTLDSEIEGVILNGESVELQGQTRGGWVFVSGTTSDDETQTGWVWSGYLTSCQTAIAPQGPMEGGPDSMCRRVVYEAGLSIHANPDLSSDRRGSVLPGDTLELASTETRAMDGAVWMEVAEPAEGWAAVRSLVRPGRPLNVTYCP